MKKIKYHIDVAKCQWVRWAFIVIFHYTVRHYILFKFTIKYRLSTSIGTRFCVVTSIICEDQTVERKGL
jgi:hypothetical protein